MSAPVLPWVAEHINEAEANYRRYERMMELPSDVSWGSVFLFYSVIHLIQAYAYAKTPLDIPRDHDTRRFYVGTTAKFPNAIVRAYKRLDDNSMDVRYDLVVRNEDYVNSLHSNEFGDICFHLRKQGISWY
jgi:hypothetical protein